MIFLRTGIGMLFFTGNETVEIYEGEQRMPTDSELLRKDLHQIGPQQKQQKPHQIERQNAVSHL